MSHILQATLSRPHVSDPTKVILVSWGRDGDELRASVVGKITDRHAEAAPEERPDWFPGQLVYDSVEIPIPAYTSEHRFAAVLSIRDLATLAELRELLDQAEAMLTARYAVRVDEDGDRA